MLVLTPSTAVTESSLPAAGALGPTDILVVSQAGAEVRTTLGALRTFAGLAGASGGATPTTATITTPGNCTAGQPLSISVSITGPAALWFSLLTGGVETTRVSYSAGTTVIVVTPTTAGATTANFYAASTGGAPVASSGSFTVAAASSGSTIAGTITAPASGSTHVGSPASFTLALSGSGSLYASLSSGGTEQGSRVAVTSADTSVSLTPTVAAATTANLYAAATGGSPVASSASFTVQAAVAPSGLLLDNLTSTYVFAWATRLLRTGYAGKCIRVQNQSTYASFDIGFDGSGNISAADIATAQQGNTGDLAITTYYNQSTSGTDLTSGYAGRVQIGGSPAATIGGRVAVVGDTGVATGSVSISGGQISAYGVSVLPASGQGGNLMAYLATGDTDPSVNATSIALMNNANNGGYAVHTNNVAQVNVLPATYSMATAYDGAALTIWINGSTTATVASSGAIGATGVLRLEDTGTAYAELLVASGVNPTDRAAIHTSQAAYYGVA